MWRTTLLIFLNVSIMVTAQQINLCGIVINQSGTPVKGLVVKLINNQLSDTTNAKGKFLLQLNETTVALKSDPIHEKIMISGNQLIIPGEIGDRNVSLKLYDLNGAEIFSENNLQSGQSLPIAPLINSSKIQIAAITFKNESVLFTVMKVGNSLLCRKVGSKVQSTLLKKNTAKLSGDSLMIIRRQQVEYVRYQSSLIDTLSLQLDLTPFEVLDFAIAENRRYPDEVGKDLTVYPNAISNYLAKTGAGAHNYEAWCSEFVSWTYKAAGYPLTGGTEGGWMFRGSTQLRTWFRRNATFVDRTSPEWSSFQPAPGDFVRYENSKGGHSGIVQYVSNDTLYTVEGNVSNMVRLRRIPRWKTYGNQTTYIDGIGRRSGVMKPVL